MVIGASPTLKPVIFCGVLSSRIRNRSCGIFGIGLPLLSSTATSSVTVITSDRNVGAPCGSPSLLGLYFDGIFSAFGSVVVVSVDAGALGSVEGLVVFFFPTVSLPCVTGP